MATVPRIDELDRLPYAAITLHAPMNRFAEEARPLIGEVFGWLAGRGVAARGAPFWKYNVIDMAGTMELEIGVGVSDGDVAAGDERVHLGALPAGRYAVVEHTGHPSTLVGVTGNLLGWAAGEGLRWDVADSPDGERWAGRVEFYETDPDVEPDMDKWRTRLAFKLAE